jgi:hypothetical protein
MPNSESRRCKIYSPKIQRFSFDEFFNSLSQKRTLQNPPKQSFSTASANNRHTVPAKQFIEIVVFKSTIFG